MLNFAFIIIVLLSIYWYITSMYINIEINDILNILNNTHIDKMFINRNTNYAYFEHLDESFQVILPKNNLYEFEHLIKNIDNTVQIFYYEDVVSFTTIIQYLIIGMIVIQIVSSFFGVILSKDSDLDDNNFSLHSMFVKDMDVSEYKPIDVVTKFSDIAGCNEAKKEVMKFVKMLKEREKFIKSNAKLPRGILLEGPSGCGKTLLAKAVAGEAGVTFLSTTGSDFNEIFVGVGSTRVKKLFDRARESKPAIIYIDEIDSIGSNRGKMHLREHDNVLNKILTEMDGFKDNDNVIVFASTNMGHKLDKALIRSGRFDTKIIIDYPTLSEREEIIDLYLSKIKLDFVESKIPVIIAEKVKELIFNLAKKTFGLSGADIKNFINQANIDSILTNDDGVTTQQLYQSLDNLILGNEKKSKQLSVKEIETIGYHEAGHALMGYLLKNVESPEKISIIPRGKALGYTQQILEEKYLYTKDELYSKICVLYGGRIAEELFLKRITNGASDDIKKATNLMYSVFSEMGMNKELGEIYYDINSDNKNHVSDSKHYEIELLVSNELKTLYNKTSNILTYNKDKLIQLAKLIIEKETVYFEDIVSLLGEHNHNNIII